MQEKNREATWYRKLKLSQKYKLNTISGAILALLGVLVIGISGHEMTHHLPEAIHAGLGSLLFLLGLWLFAAGIRYQSQLDTIRISRKNNRYRKGPKKSHKDKQG